MTVSSGHCYHSDVNCGHSFPLHLDEFGILVIHVINSYLMQFAQLCGIFQDFTGLVAMDMNPDQSIVAGDYQRLPFLFEVFFNFA